MSPDSFHPNSPGRLVPTSFTEPSLNAGTAGKYQLVEGCAFVPDDLPPPLDQNELLGHVWEELILSERLLARLDGVADDLPNARLLWAPLSRREAILSSKIENTIASAQEIVLVEAGEKPQRMEALEVANYVRAIDHGLNSGLPICLRLFKETHGHLLGYGVRGSHDQPGQFRTTQNYIGQKELGFSEARFVPPPPGSYLEQGLASLEAYANRQNFDIPVLVAIALVHYQFETLHPFRDGNGRIGRLISALSLCRMGRLGQPFVYLSGYFEAHRQRYNDLMLRVSTDGEWLPWIKFFLEAVASQATDAYQRVDRLRELRTTFRTRLTEANAPAKTMPLIDRLFIHPVLTAQSTARTLRVSKPTARNYINRLVDLGALVELTREYRKTWIAPGIIAVIDV